MILCGDFKFHFQTNSVNAVKFLNMSDLYGFTPLDAVSKVIPLAAIKVNFFIQFFFSKNAMDYKMHN